MPEMYGDWEWDADDMIVPAVDGIDHDLLDDALNGDAEAEQALLDS